MNKHIIVEDKPGDFRRALMSAMVSCAIFFVLGFFGRPIWDYTWDRLMDTPPVLVPCVPDPKPTLHWSKK